MSWIWVEKPHETKFRHWVRAWASWGWSVFVECDEITRNKSRNCRYTRANKTIPSPAPLNRLLRGSFLMWFFTANTNIYYYGLKPTLFTQIYYRKTFIHIIGKSVNFVFIKFISILFRNKLTSIGCISLSNFIPKLFIIECIEKKGLGIAIMNRLLLSCSFNYLEK